MTATEAQAHMLIDDIARLSGRGVKAVRPFATGNGVDIFIADLNDGRRVVVKRARDGNGRLDIEGWMLKYLRERAQMPVPAVHCAEKSLLIIDYVPDNGRLSPAVEEDAAIHLSRLHAIRAPQYGLERDTLIGPLPQPNTPSDNWLEFFRDFRLVYMARKAYEEKALSLEAMGRVGKLAEALDKWIGKDAAPPSLIHGDLWSGNVLTSANGVAGFIDPAIYYADPEIELAFIRMFSTFGERFFRRYGELAGMRDGFFDGRCDVYALYPLLVHARLFGGGYAGKVDQIARRLIG
jgi:fructosamine-3-kinase